jgi:hypothetical protein
MEGHRMMFPDTPKRDNPEERLQAAIVQHLNLLAPDNVIWFHPANGGMRSKRTAARMKALGVVPGVPDLAFVLADGRSAFLELKSPVGRLSPAQKAFGEKCARMEVEYAVSSDLDQCLSILKAWGVLPN